ncbi:MAG: hypothetical protein LQ348_001032 [Seirophora lacunosa]|nr:MAG: hypothetical protein LQ344_002341 [Seirophora lacunosa]KAI4206205.1 MAG: hypothetical protein LQ348_001032 [Seirophora lacunosa]
MKVPFRIRLAISAVLTFILLAQASSRSREPITRLSLVENPDIRTPSHRVHAFSDFDLLFDLHPSQQQVKFTLEPNHDIIPQGATVTYLNRDGSVRRAESINRHHHRVFKGEARIQDPHGNWMSAGWARITVTRDGLDPLFEGAFTIGRDHHHILLRSNYLRTKHVLDPDVASGGDDYMIVYRDSDIFDKGANHYDELKRSGDNGHSCSSNHLAFNTDPSHPVFAPPSKQQAVGLWGSTPVNSLFGKRQIDTGGIPNGGNSAGVNLRTTIGDSAGCPTTRKVALVGVATDCGYTASFDSEEALRQNVIQQFQTVSNLYENTFNITLSLANLTISPEECPAAPAQDTPWNVGCGGGTTITDRLNLFSQWRGERADQNAFWTLLTNCATGSEVGLAWLGQLCVTDVKRSSGEIVSGANVAARTSNEWQVIAHEIGHTFGAVHDCDSSACANQNSVLAQQCCPLSASVCPAGERFIMNPSTGQGISEFSPCTLGNVCSAIGRNSVQSSCLMDNKDVPSTITGQQCGNGIVEDGEECDCGGTAGCGDNQCCEPETCRFRAPAVCDDSNESCCRGCQFTPAGVVCRASAGVCDPEETCSGNNATCPTDASAPDGQSCGDDSANTECASGQCTSRNQQCKTLMGSFTSNNDTYACNSQECTVSCASPEFGSGVCYSMQQNFLDGTPCGGGGRCSNGQCNGSSTAREIGSWISGHKDIVIGIAAGVGGLILLAILSCCIRRCRRPKRVRARSPPMHQGWAGGPMPPGNGWNNASARGSRAPNGYWNGPSAPQWQHPPPPVPPQYLQPSVRYA